MMSYIAEKLTIDFPGPAVMAADVVSFQQSLSAR
jgi:hypothetical protein